MISHARIRQQLYEYMRGELPHKEQESIDAHLDRCAACRGELEELRSAMMTVPPQQVRASDQRAEAYWQSFAARVESRIAETRQKPSSLKNLAPRLRELWFLRPRMAAALSGAMAVVLIAAGLWLASGNRQNAGTQNNAGAVVVPARTNEAVEEYLSSSRMLLVGITNMEPNAGEPIDFGVEKNAARALVRQARMLSPEGVDERSQELIRELSRILIELANMEESADIPEVEMIRTGVRQQNLLFKIRMAEERVGQGRYQAEDN